MTQRLFVLLLLAVPLALAGCGRELVGAGQGGEVSTAVVDDPSMGSSSSGPSYSRAGGQEPGGGAATGTADAVLGVELVRSDGRVVALTGQSASLRLRLSSSDSVVLDERQVASGSYTVARVIFRQVIANVTGGLTVGGVSLVGRVDVGLSQPVVVERPIQLSIRDGTRAQLVVDLNSEVWLNATNPVTRVVPAAALQSAVAVRVR